MKDKYRDHRSRSDCRKTINHTYSGEIINLKRIKQSSKLGLIQILNKLGTQVARRLHQNCISLIKLTCSFFKFLQLIELVMCIGDYTCKYVYKISV